MRPVAITRRVSWALFAVGFAIPIGFHLLGYHDEALYGALIVIAGFGIGITYLNAPMLMAWPLVGAAASAVAVALRVAQDADGPPQGAARVAFVAACLFYLSVPLTYGLPAAFKLWRVRRGAGFGDRLVHEVVVPPGPDGRPGERLLAYSRSTWNPRTDPLPIDHVRADLNVFVGFHSSVGVVCMGPESTLGDAKAVTHTSISQLEASGCEPSAPVPDSIAGEDAYRSDVAVGKLNLTAWKLVHKGWVYDLILRRSRVDDEDEMHRRARAMFDTWRWIDA